MLGVVKGTVQSKFRQHKSMEENNFGWSQDRFVALKQQIQEGQTAEFRADLSKYMAACTTYVMNLARNWVGKAYLDQHEKGMVQDALLDALARFEQRMNDNTVVYGNLKSWLAGNAFERFQRLFEKEQAEKKRLSSIDAMVSTPMAEEKADDMVVYLIAEALNRMPDNAKYYYRRTLKMLHWEGYEIQEIAEKIEVGYDNLRAELSRKIRPLFKAELEALALQFNMDLTKHRIPTR